MMIHISLVSRSILGRSGRFSDDRPKVNFLGRPKNDLNRPNPNTNVMDPRESIHLL